MLYSFVEGREQVCLNIKDKFFTPPFYRDDRREKLFQAEAYISYITL